MSSVNPSNTPYLKSTCIDDIRYPSIFEDLPIEVKIDRVKTLILEHGKAIRLHDYNKSVISSGRRLGHIDWDNLERSWMDAMELSDLLYKSHWIHDLRNNLLLIPHDDTKPLNASNPKIDIVAEPDLSDIEL